MSDLPAPLPRRRQARQIDAIVDEALLDLSPEQKERVSQLRDTGDVRHLAECIRGRAAVLGKRRPGERQRIQAARDDIIMMLYAAAGPRGWAVAWCDGSSIKVDSGHRSGIGGIVMDSSGVVITRSSQAVGDQDAFTAELAALALVIRSAVEHQQRRLWVYTDNHGLVRLWQKRHTDGRLAEIRRLTETLERFALRAIPRQYNQPANALARQAARSERPVDAIRAVLFDFGGVLAEEGFRNGLVALAREQGSDITNMAEEGMRAVYDSGFVLGRGTAADFWALMRQRTGLAGEDDELSKRILDAFIFRPWMVDLVRRLRDRGYVTGILSDQTHWLDTLDERDHFYKAFDRIYNSYHLGKGKRDPSLFGDVATDLGIPPSAILFVDDDAGNAARARASGLRAIQFADRESFISELERQLSLKAQ